MKIASKVKFALKKFAYLFVAVSLFLQTVGVAFAGFIDSSQANFDSGTHSGTQYDSGNSWLELDSSGLSGGTGTFTSRIYTSTYYANWYNLSWIPQRPLYKELPNYKAAESGYDEGEINMNYNSALLHFNEGSGSTTFADGSGSSNYGSCTTGQCPSVTTSGRFNNAFTFDGVNDTVSLPSRSLANLLGSQWTISFWAYSTTGNDRPAFGFTNTGGAYQDSPVASMANNLIIGDGSTYQSLSPLPKPAASTWTHYAIVANGSAYKVYVNGEEVSSTAITVTPTSTSDRVFVIGQSGALESENYFPGRIDEFAIFKNALSATSVLDAYKRGILRAKFQIRACTEETCAGEDFVGYAGTSYYYEEQDNNTSGTPSFSISPGQSYYFQYRVIMETDNAAYSPEIDSVTIYDYATDGNGDSLPEFSTMLMLLILGGGILYVRNDFAKAWS